MTEKIPPMVSAVNGNSPKGGNMNGTTESHGDTGRGRKKNIRRQTTKVRTKLRRASASSWSIDSDGDESDSVPRTQVNTDMAINGDASVDYTTTADEQQKLRLRQWHNRIGKKYRNKLTEQFEGLQAVLRIGDAYLVRNSGSSGGSTSDLASRKGPSGEGEQDMEGRSGSHIRVGGRAMNKAKLLDMARERIEALTREREALMAEREALLSRTRATEVALGMISDSE